MKKIKHSKLKNTSILFELLVRQITADTLNNVNESKAGELIRKYFHKNAPLSKELGLYQTLVKEKFNTNDKAASLVEACLSARRKLNSKTLAREKYNLNKEIKENWNQDSFYDARINNYKVLASIYKLFEYNTEDNPKVLVESKYTLLEHITFNKPKETKKSVVTETLNKEDKDIRQLTYKLLVEKFNDKYNGLNLKQKKLLETYIKNDSSSPILKEYIKAECLSLQKELTKLNNSVSDTATKIKVNESISLLDGFNQGKQAKDDEVLALLRYYELAKELKKTNGDK